MRPNLFANTPDILHEYLQHGGRPAFQVRLVLAATLGATYGIYSGFELVENVPVQPGSEEYLDSEKYQVRLRNYRTRQPRGDSSAQVNAIRRDHPALQRDWGCASTPRTTRTCSATASAQTTAPTSCWWSSTSIRSTCSTGSSGCR